MHFGSDPDCISKFLEAGFAIRSTSGVFKFNMDMSQQISTVIVQVCIVVPDITPFTVLILSCCQTAQMAKYATAYGDFTIVDGTHNTTVYDLKLIPFTNVDCLGKSVVTGFMLDESENTTTVSESLQLFGLDTQGATLMTDGGSAYPGVAMQAGMVHILCTHHFQQDIFSSCGGMGPASDIFKKDAMSLIYSSFPTKECFDLQANTFLENYSSFPSASACLRKILKDKSKVCRAYTGN
jgi:hypothetical protein